MKANFKNLSSIVIKDTGWNKVSEAYFFLIAISFILGAIILPYLSLYVFPSILGSSLNLPDLTGFLILGNTPLIILVVRLISFLTPLQKTKVIISNTELKICLQNKLFFHILLNEIESIEAIRIKLMGYKIIFKNLNTENVLRLHLFLFKKKKQKLFVDHLKYISKNLNIEYIERIQKAYWYAPEENKRNEKIIKDFILNSKNILKEK